MTRGQSRCIASLGDERLRLQALAQALGNPLAWPSALCFLRRGFWRFERDRDRCGAAGNIPCQRENVSVVDVTVFPGRWRH